MAFSKRKARQLGGSIVGYEKLFVLLVLKKCCNWEMKCSLVYLLIILLEGEVC